MEAPQGSRDNRKVVRLNPDEPTAASRFDHCTSEIPQLPPPKFSHVLYSLSLDEVFTFIDLGLLD